MATRKASSAIRGHMKVTVRLPEFIVWVPEHMEEVAVFPLWTFPSVEKTTYGCFPSSYWGEFTLQLSSSVPAAIKHHERFSTLLLCVILNVNVPSQVRFKVAAHLELQHPPCVLELWQSVFIEIQELLVHFLLAVLKTGISVVVIPSALLHPECHKHPPHHQSGAGCWVLMLSGAPVSKPTSTRFKEEGAVCLVLFSSKILWGIRVFPRTTIFQLTLCLIQHFLYSFL